VVTVRTRIALGTLCVFNAMTVAALGLIALLYVNGADGPLSAAALWLGSTVLWLTAKRLRRSTDWP